jgi:hypothetical protein
MSTRYYSIKAHNSHFFKITRALPVSEQEYLSAIKDLLKKVNLPLDLERENLITQVVKLQEKADNLEAENKELNAKIEEQEQKLELLEHSVTCQICKENSADYCLAPCGHILCQSCNESWRQHGWNNKCPFCRYKISYNN